MSIKIKNGECFGSVFVVVFNNDGFYDPRVFTEREKMIAFTTYLDNLGKEYNVFEETLDREYDDNYRILGDIPWLTKDKKEKCQ